jgi:hypothetical protein
VPSALVCDLARYRPGLVPEISRVDARGGWPEVSPVLAAELATVPEPRRAAGRRFDLVFLPGIVVMAVLAGATWSRSPTSTARRPWRCASYPASPACPG